jgi:hypothetical protein
LAEVQRTYRGQLEEYRTAQQQFVVAQQEFKQLGTLTSLESAVRATQKVFIIRDQVLLTYVKMLELQVRSAEGIELKLKEEGLFVLEETTKALTRHLETTQTSVDRQAVALRAEDFASLEPLYSFSVDFNRQLLVQGKLRNGYDTAVGVFTDLSSADTTGNALAREERTRALEEVRLKIQEVDLLLGQSEAELEKALEDGRVNKSKTLDEAYVELIQAANFLDEVYKL